MSDEILSELAATAVAKKPAKNAKAPATPVDVFIKTAKFQIAKATAVSEEKSSFEIDGKSYDTSELRSDWFKSGGDSSKYWVQFGFNPVPLTDVGVTKLYMPAADIEKVIDILNKGISLATSNEKFQKRIIATAEAAKRPKPTDVPVTQEKSPKRTRGPNKPKS